MKISRDSWHFKLNEYRRGAFLEYDIKRGKINLCRYFWTTVLSIIFSPFKLLFKIIYHIRIPLTVFVGMLSIYSMIRCANWFGDKSIKCDNFLWNMLAVWGWLIIIFGIMVTMVYLEAIFSRKKLHRKHYDFKKTLIYKYYKAKKQKVCPIIELEKEERE